MCLVVITAACGGGATSEVPPTPLPKPTKLTIYTVNYPLAYFAKRIGSDAVEVVLPVPPDVDPAYWTPSAEIVEKYQRADLIVLNGADYAKWVSYATLPLSKILDTSATISDRWIALEDAVTHSHGSDGEHAHGGWANTTWLDPALAIEQARAIEAALISRLPGLQTIISEQASDLVADLEALDARLAAAAETIGDEPLLFSHPVYQYLIARYGLNAVELHWEPDQTPDGHAWDHLAEAMEEHTARWMLWEGSPLPTTVTSLAERDITSLVYQPCANVPASGDFLTVMAANAEALETIAESFTVAAQTDSVEGEQVEGEPVEGEGVKTESVE
jgi:zinc transport system substrate-binding protein